MSFRRKPESISLSLRKQGSNNWIPAFAGMTKSAFFNTPISSMKDPREHLMVALDAPSFDEAVALVKKLKGTLKYFKVGLALYTQSGPKIIDVIHNQGGEVFLDLKFHDIPSTVARAVEEACRLNVFMMNVHATGGLEMMQAAREAVAPCRGTVSAKRKPLLVAVTVLTSLADLKPLGIFETIPNQVLRLARLTKEAGLDGVVASPLETAMIRKECGEKFVIVTPGIRPAGSGVGDQKRLATPRDAIQNGANFLVVGRPITEASDPAAATNRCLALIGHRWGLKTPK